MQIGIQEERDSHIAWKLMHEVLNILDARRTFYFILNFNILEECYFDMYDFRYPRFTYPWMLHVRIYLTTYWQTSGQSYKPIASWHCQADKLTI